MSTDAQFKTFVERQRRSAAVDVRIDWNKERDEWLGYLQQLYDRITEYLDAYIKSGVIALRQSPIELNEENIGIYTAQPLAIAIGAQEIMLTPVGTPLIGSKGRVDVEGSKGVSRLVLIHKHVSDASTMFPVKVGILKVGDTPEQPEPRHTPLKIDWTWKIVSRAPAIQFVELNKHSFFEMLMEVGHG